MMKKLFILPILIFFGCSSSDEEQLIEPEIVASAEIFKLDPVSEQEFSVTDLSVGKATFSQFGNIVKIELEMAGMEPNSSKAVHIHNGTVQFPGRHWNAGKFVAACSEESLGQPWQRPFIGDVGNVNINENGDGTFVLQTDLWKINSGDNFDILEKVIVVHDEPQDFVEECDPFHSHDYLHSNKKIGGGVIELLSDVERNAQSYVFVEQKMADFLICK